MILPLASSAGGFINFPSHRVDKSRKPVGDGASTYPTESAAQRLILGRRGAVPYRLHKEGYKNLPSQTGHSRRLVDYLTAE